MVTDDIFKMKKRKSVRSEAELDDLVNDSAVVGNGMLTPDVMLQRDEKFIIIDAYNGSNEKEIKTKPNLYMNGFKCAEEVYVATQIVTNTISYNVAIFTTYMIIGQDAGQIFKLYYRAHVCPAAIEIGTAIIIVAGHTKTVLISGLDGVASTALPSFYAEIGVTRV